MMQQFAMLSTNATAHNFVPQTAQVFNQQHQNYGGQCNGGRTGGRSQGRRGHPCHAPAAGGTIVPFVPPTLPGAIPFIDPGIPPTLQQQNPCFSNITKYWANQNMCFLAALGWKTGTIVKLAPERNPAIKMVLLVPTSWNMKRTTISFVGR
jgi:hypothetical protein